MKTKTMWKYTLPIHSNYPMKTVSIAPVKVLIGRKYLSAAHWDERYFSEAKPDRNGNLMFESDFNTVLFPAVLYNTEQEAKERMKSDQLIHDLCNMHIRSRWQELPCSLLQQIKDFLQAQEK